MVSARENREASSVNESSPTHAMTYTLPLTVIPFPVPMDQVSGGSVSARFAATSRPQEPLEPGYKLRDTTPENRNSAGLSYLDAPTKPDEVGGFGTTRVTIQPAFEIGEFSRTERAHETKAAEYTAASSGMPSRPSSPAVSPNTNAYLKPKESGSADRLPPKDSPFWRRRFKCESCRKEPSEPKSTAWSRFADSASSAWNSFWICCCASKPRPRRCPRHRYYDYRRLNVPEPIPYAADAAYLVPCCPYHYHMFHPLSSFPTWVYPTQPHIPKDHRWCCNRYDLVHRRMAGAVPPTYKDCYYYTGSPRCPPRSIEPQLKPFIEPSPPEGCGYAYPGAYQRVNSCYV